MSIFFIYLILLTFVCNLIEPSNAIVLLKSLTTSFLEIPARFALGINSSGICGALHVADPVDACSSLLGGFDNSTVNLALIVRGNCTFEHKIRNAQDAGFHAAIVYDDQDQRNLISMIGSSEGIWLHAVFVSRVAGETLKNHAQGEEGECCIIPSLEETTWIVLIRSFLSLVIASVLATFFFTRICWQNQRGTANLVDEKLVELLPCFTFSAAHISGYLEEMCAICLEGYKDGERLKILLCQHEFHAHCVDSWLTKWNTFCPVCKYDVRTEVLRSDVSARRRSLVF